MATRSNNNIIVINRGDSFSFDLEINQEDWLYLYLGIMDPNQMFEDALVKKRYSQDDLVDNKITIKLEPEDTLDLFPGTYYYSIKLRDNDDNVTTLLSYTKFIICE